MGKKSNLSSGNKSSEFSLKSGLSSSSALHGNGWATLSNASIPTSYSSLTTSSNHVAQNFQASSEYHTFPHAPSFSPTSLSSLPSSAMTFTHRSSFLPTSLPSLPSTSMTFTAFNHSGTSSSTTNFTLPNISSSSGYSNHYLAGLSLPHSTLINHTAPSASHLPTIAASTALSNHPTALATAESPSFNTIEIQMSSSSGKRKQNSSHFTPRPTLAGSQHLLNALSDLFTAGTNKSKTSFSYSSATSAVQTTLTVIATLDELSTSLRRPASRRHSGISYHQRNSNDETDSIYEYESDHPQTRSIGAFIGKTPVDFEINYLYRGTKQKPKKTFARGFKALGENTDLRCHLDPEIASFRGDSAFIATSTSKENAGKFPHVLENAKGYLYEINPQNRGINVEKILTIKIKGIQVFVPNAEDMESIKSEKTVAVPHKIKNTDVRGAWQIDSMGDNPHGEEIHVVRDTFIPNPNYIPPTVIRAAQIVRVIGRGVVAVGATLDGLSLLQAYDESNKTGSYLPVPREIFRISASWHGAIVLGGSYGKAGATFCASFGPWASLSCGVGGVIIGSAIGYSGCGQLATNLVKPERSIDRSNRLSELEAYDREWLMSKSSTFSKKHKTENFIRESAQLRAEDPIFNAIDNLTIRSKALMHLYELQKSLRHGPSFPLVETTLKSATALNEAIQKIDVESGSQLFVDAAVLDNRDLEITKTLANMGSTCSKATMLTLSNMGRQDVIKVCKSKPERKMDGR